VHTTRMTSSCKAALLFDAGGLAGAGDALPHTVSSNSICCCDPALCHALHMAESLTRQELIYAAKALRQAARTAEKQAADPGFTSMRQVPAESARAQDELAAKCERMAKQIKC
jgi:hypothetical protein